MKEKMKEKMKENKLLKTIMIIMLIVVYVAADLIMDKTLFPMLTESFKQHHIEIVARYMIFFHLVWVWLAGFIFSKYLFKKQKNKLVKLSIIFFGSSLAATVIFAFTSLPLIWIASTIPLLTSTCLFLHDYGLFVYFVIMIVIFGYKYFRTSSV